MLQTSFHSSLHSTRLSIYHFVMIHSHWRVLVVWKHFTSSTNKARELEWDKSRGISLIHETKKAGPSSDPCGTPKVTDNQPECLPSITTVASCLSDNWWTTAAGDNNYIFIIIIIIIIITIIINQSSSIIFIILLLILIIVIIFSHHLL